ncbi:MAG: helix-turn-helix domain-containing protein [Bacteroidota bacterium]
MNIDFVSILLFLGMGQCLFLMVTVLVDRKTVRPANYLLAALLFAFLWYQLEFFLLRHTLDSRIPFIFSTRYGSWLIVGPLIFLYNRAILIKDFKLNRRDLLHFLPILLFTFLLPVFFDDFITDRAVNYGMLTVFDSWNQETITSKHYLYAYIFMLQFLHALIYLFQAYRESKQLLAEAKERQANIPLDKIKSLQYLYLLALLIILFCSAFVIYQYATKMWQRTFDYLYVLPTLVFVFGLAYRAMKYPNSVFLIKEDIPQAKYAKSGLSKGAKDSLIKKLKEKLEVDKVYRNNELRLSALAEELGVSTHHLSQLINEELKQNFFDLINTYRINEAKDKIATGSSRTLLEVAYEVGFNSKNSFNNAFKKNEGMTPSAFKKSI